VFFRLGWSAALVALVVAFMLTLPGSQVSAAAMPPEDLVAKPVVAVRLAAGERIVLDGTLAHPAWQRAPVHNAFVEKFPATGNQPQHETRVQVLFDEQALYVGVQALDPQPGLIRDDLVRYDGVNRTQDFVVVYIDAIGHRQSAQFFRVNAAGSMADGMHTAADDSEDFSPDFDFDAATARNANGYTAVLRIPFASLRFSSETASASGAQAWRFMVGRRVPREQFYLYTSVHIPRESPSFIATLQPLQGVELPQDHQFLSLRPSLTWHQSREQPAQGPATGSHKLDATLDLKWRPMAEWVVDATLNPDFSQVALDVPQLAGNTRFALSFPETRPFFYESSDLLRSPTEAVYTRSITAPRGGLRSTWRGTRWAGSAFAIDDRGGGLVLLPGPFSTGQAEQPASTATVARFRAGAEGLQWGGIAARRQYSDDKGDNLVVGPDLAWQLTDDWRLRAQWLQSATTALPTGGGLARGVAVRGQRAYAKLWYQTPALEGELSLDASGAGFRDDIGFVAQTGVRAAKGRLGWGWTNVGPFNDFWVNLEAEQTADRATGQTVSHDLRSGVWFTGAHNLEAWVQWHPLSQQRTAAGANALHERYLSGNLVVTPATWLPLLVLDAKLGQLADVVANRVRPGGQVTLTLTTRPLARLELEPRISLAWLGQGGQRLYTEAAHQLLARWHFNDRQSLRAIVQYASLDRVAEAGGAGLPAVAAQRWAGTTGSLTWSWRQSAGTLLHLGLARSRDGEAFAQPLPWAVSRRNEAFVKLQLDVDEVRRRL
jgi:hypothetical protein